MPKISDQHGTRDVANDELARLDVESCAEFAASWDALEWRPIGEYDRAAAAVQLLRDGSQWAIGFWGDTTLRDDERGERWRDVQESMDEAPLRFEPVEFAALDDRLRVALMAD